MIKNKARLMNRRLLRQILLGLALTTAIAIPQTVVIAAEQGAAEFTLDQVVVTAQRRATSDLNTPAAVTVISAAELEATGAINIFDALEHTIGVGSMSYGPNGTDYGMSASRINIRGFEQGTLVLVNGSPVNLLNYNNTSGIPLAAVEKVEIIRGAAATLYGSEALTGVVNIITKKPDGQNRTTISLTGSNYNQAWSLGTQFENGSLYVQRQYIGDVDRSSRQNLTNKTSNAAIEPWGLKNGYRNNLYYTAKLNERLNFNWSYVDAQNTRTRYKASPETPYMDYVYDDRRNNINFVYSDANEQFRSVLSYNQRRSHADKYDYATKKWGISERYDLYSINWDNQKTWQLRDNLDTLVAGITVAKEHYHDPSTDNAAIRKNAQRDSVAAYGSYTYAVNPRFSTTFGLRTHFISDYAKTEQVVLPQIQTLYKIADNTSWYTNIGKSFQMPALNQYFRTGSTSTVFTQLKPQRGWNYETGLKRIRENDSWKLAVYHIELKDKFAWHTDNTGPVKIEYMYNAGDYRNTGVELEYAKRLNENWQYKLGCSYSNPEINEKGSWSQFNSRIQTNAAVTYNRDKWLTNVNLLYLGDREESGYKINGKISAVPDRIQLNAVIRYQAAANQSVALNLYNILARDNSVNKYENLDLPFNWTLNYTYSF